jgi:hypothetical protein
LLISQIITARLRSGNVLIHHEAHENHERAGAFKDLTPRR